MAPLPARSTLTRTLLALFLPLALAACGINSVPTAEENAKAKWADVQASYQRRADLIPSLVAVAQNAAKMERGTLEAVINARASATQVKLSADDLSDPAKVQAYQAAQANVSGSLSRLLVTMEQYPELKSQDRFADLQTQLEGTENRINISIRDYNAAVQDYNTRIRTFPEMIGAKLVHGSKPLTPFQAKAGADTAPDVGAMFNGSK
ncbi:LemA family protein [Sphingobium nicotianae]|uniref:LemA family protein n=1 Tax=Sphingobium nicotianae TaxID=2782607 RepID=A0A9X1IR51_9SPHN|nr:LemA family protein [Sphingobium nicotianae]MBT2187141.1 LemA family protein [Sphingobium nicotianae]